MRRIWGKRGAGEVKGRTALRRARFVLALGVLLAAGLMASGAFGRISLLSTTSDSTSTVATDTTQTATSAPTDTTPSTTDTSSTSPGTTPTTPQTWTPTITSDQADYAPGATVTLTGAGWAPFDSVHIFVNDDIRQTWSYNTDVTSDANGAFTTQFSLP